MLFLSYFKDFYSFVDVYLRVIVDFIVDISGDWVYVFKYFYFFYVFFLDCIYNGQIYKVGVVFFKGDNCNRCICMVIGIVFCIKDLCVLSKIKYFNCKYL